MTDDRVKSRQKHIDYNKLIMIGEGYTSFTQIWNKWLTKPYIPINGKEWSFKFFICLLRSDFKGFNLNNFLPLVLWIFGWI